jgi:hypothetical protein
MGKIKFTITLYMNAISVLKNKIDLVNEVNVQLQMEDDIFWINIFDYVENTEEMDEDVKEYIQEDADVDELMKFITVDESSVEFDGLDDDEVLMYNVTCYFDCGLAQEVLRRQLGENDE